MSSSGPRLTLAEVHAGYRRGLRTRRVLRGLSLDVAPGSIAALVGPNGAGKTTLIRLVLGFLPVRSGRVEVGGAPPAAYRARRGVAYLPEGVALPPGWRVRDLVAAGRTLAGERGPTTRALLARVGLEGLAGARTGALSRGQSRRVALAWALAGSPGLVLLDEPWSGLDPRERSRLRGVVRALRDEGKTVCLSSHEAMEVERVADVVHVLAGGKAGRSLRPTDWGRGGLEALVASDPAYG